MTTQTIADLEIIGRAIREQTAEEVDEILFLGGYDAAIVGTGEREGEVVFIYDTEILIDLLTAEAAADFDPEDEDAQDPREAALEHFGYNIESAYLGPTTPIYISRACPQCGDSVALCGMVHDDFPPFSVIDGGLMNRLRREDDTDEDGELVA